MKKNAGFTLVEVIVSFAITMIVVLFLFQLVIMLKNIYNNNYVASDLVLKQANISQMINNDLMTSNLGNINNVTPRTITVNSSCYTLTFERGSRTICYDKDNNIVSYNDYEFALVNNSKIGNVDIKFETVSSSNMLFINIPITYPDIDKDFDIKISYFK